MPSIKIIQTIRENVGWKIAVVTSVALLFVALLLIVSFSVIPVQLFSKFNLIQILISLVIVLTTLAVLVIYISTVVMIQRPLDRLIQVITQAEAGDLSVRAPVEKIDEIGELTAKFNEMLRKIHELDHRKISTERELVKAQEELHYKTLLEEKAKIIEETNRQLARMVSDFSILYQVSQKVSSTIVPEELYNVLIDVVVKTLGFQEFALLIFDQSSQRLHVKSAYGFKDNYKVKELNFALGEGISGRVAQKKELIYIPDTSKDETYLHYKGEKMEEGSFLSLPIVGHHRLLGVMNFTRPTTHAFSPMDIKLLTSLGSQLAVAMENSRLYEKTKELSITDELTGLHNRRHFQTMLQMEWKRAKRFQRSLAVLLIDVDHFKKYNDTYGHSEGDRVLEQVSRILEDHVREVDTVARYGGEEFAILLTHANQEEATTVAKKLCELIEKHPFKYEKMENAQQVTISVGVSTYPEDAQNLDDLIDHADIALYEAKGRGRNRVVSFLGMCG
ncbi:MAG: diguanylate cyclase [Deltaproteobacteria bacterium]|nr:diguanylate cyclase [Deltaproteobacteria bacterium]